MLRIAGAISLVLCLAVFGYWGASGAHFITLYKVPQVVKQVDDFGDEVEITKMVDGFVFGLNPSDRLIDGALPLGGGFGGLGVVLLFVDWRKRKKT